MEQPPRIRRALARIRWYPRVHLLILALYLPLYWVPNRFGSASTTTSVVIGWMLLGGVSGSLVIHCGRAETRDRVRGPTGFEPVSWSRHVFASESERFKTRLPRKIGRD